MLNNGKNRLLLVDDSKLSLLALVYILQTDYIIHVASKGPEAIEIAKKYLPDLILLDVVMPKMDGYEVLSVLRRTQETQHIPVIFITGMDHAADEQKGLSLGAADYISKPFSSAIVKLRVQHQVRIVNQLRTIKRLSMMDYLTGLPNRRNFDQRIIEEWGRAKRDNQPISMLMIDVDHFKGYNDTFGHQQGDVGLIHVARVISESLYHPSDFAARWGGEEFAVLLPNTAEPGCLIVSEKIRHNTEQTMIPNLDGTPTWVTVSIGTNTTTPSLRSSFDKFISNADFALYQAKEKGRNRVFSAAADSIE